MSERILRPREVAARLGVSLSTIWRLRANGILPDPLRISAQCCGWPASEIDAYLAGRPRAAGPTRIQLDDTTTH